MRAPLESRRSTLWSPLVIVARKIVFGALIGAGMGLCLWVVPSRRVASCQGDPWVPLGVGAVAGIFLEMTIGWRNVWSKDG